MKNILLITFWNVFIKTNMLTGSGKLLLDLYNELSNNKKYNVYLALPNIEENINNTIINCANIPNINYDLIIINGSIDLELFENYTNKLNLSSTKIFFVAHNNYYSDKDYLFFKKYCNLIIFVSEFNYIIEHDKLNSLNIKHKIIHNKYDNKFNIKFNKINLSNKTDILISYHPCKQYHEEFIKNVFKYILKELPNIKLHICFPKYGWNKDDYKNLINLINENDSIYFYETLSDKELIKLYSLCAVSIFSTKFEETLPTNMIESCLQCTFPISCFEDGSQYICSNNFIKKYKIEESWIDEQIANHIVNIIKNYNNNIKDIVHEKKLIVNKFSKLNTIDKYIEEINNYIN